MSTGLVYIWDVQYQDQWEDTEMRRMTAKPKAARIVCKTWNATKSLRFELS
jgi:hypothetical protein